jgi:hypothetical protein
MNKTLYRQTITIDSGFDKFITIYQAKLTEVIKKYPLEYCYPVSEVPTVVGKMKKAFIAKSYNKDGRAIQATCKALGIKYTYRDIDNYLGYNRE